MRRTVMEPSTANKNIRPGADDGEGGGAPQKPSRHHNGRREDGKQKKEAEISTGLALTPPLPIDVEIERESGGERNHRNSSNKAVQSPHRQRTVNRYSIEADVSDGSESNYSEGSDKLPGAFPRAGVRATTIDDLDAGTVQYSAVLPSNNFNNVDHVDSSNTTNNISDSSSGEDGKLVVAELAPETVLGTAVLSEPEQQGVPRNRVLLMIGVFVLIVASLAITLAVTLSTKEPTTTISSTDNQTVKPAGSIPITTPSNNKPTASPTSTSEFIFGVLSSLIPGFPASNTQERALTWLEDDPPTLMVALSSSKGMTSLIVQRFVLVVLYYSSTDDNDAGWQNDTLWLSEQSECEWYGITCEESGEISEINLELNSLTGSIPSEIGLMTALAWLDLDWNSFTGSIPTEMGLMAALTSLSLYENSLIGSIPTEIGLMTSLVRLYLATNSLAGSIPTEIGLMTNLEALSLFVNSLTGSMPTEMGLMSDLTYVSLWRNSLTGSIPTEIQSLTALTRLYLHTNNLSGSVPEELDELLAGLSTWCFLGCNLLLTDIPPNCDHCFFC